MLFDIVGIRNVAGVIPSNGVDRFEPKMEGRWGFVSSNFVHALVKEWESYNDLKLKTIAFSLKITYRNFSKTSMFETTCRMMFDPYVEVLKSTYGAPHNAKKLIFFEDYEFRKVAFKSK